MKLTRREAIRHLRNIICTAGVFPLMPTSLLAAPKKDDHFFIFVELKGGIHYGITTDCPDPNQLPQNNDIVMPLTLNDDGVLIHPTSFSNLTPKQKEFLQSDMSNSSLPLALSTDGYFAALPPCIAHGTTDAGYRYSLGWAGSPLKDYINKISVLRSVYMEGTFHGPANVELYSGAIDGSKPHIAGVLTELLGSETSKALDNLVLDGATYLINEHNLPAVKIPSVAINKVIEKLDERTASDAPRKIIEALQHKNKDRYGSMNSIIDAYIKSMGEAQEIKQGLKNSSFASGDLSAKLKDQLDLCASLFKNNLANVATVCTGRGGAFGNFDSHTNLYGLNPEDNQGAVPIAKSIKNTMQGVADFIDKIEKDPDLKDKTTLVVSADFGRNNNFAGSAFSQERWPHSIGNGHFFANNNYLFYGKGITGGVWIGESDPVTRYSYCLDFDRLAGATGSSILQAFVDPFVQNSKTVGGKLKIKPDFVYPGLGFDALNGTNKYDDIPHKKGSTAIRSMMARDIVRTLMSCAGHEAKYKDKYDPNDSESWPARIIAQLLR